MSRKVYVIGVGMTKFEKPGSKSWDYPDMAKEAGTKALDDAGIPYNEVEQAVVGERGVLQQNAREVRRRNRR